MFKLSHSQLSVQKEKVSNPLSDLFFTTGAIISLKIPNIKSSKPWYGVSWCENLEARVVWTHLMITVVFDDCIELWTVVIYFFTSVLPDEIIRALQYPTKYTGLRWREAWVAHAQAQK